MTRKTIIPIRNLPKSKQQRIRQVLEDFKTDVITNLKRFRLILDSKSTPKDLRACSAFCIKKDTEIIPINLICRLIGISPTYYTQLRAVNIAEWEDVYETAWGDRNNPEVVHVPHKTVISNSVVQKICTTESPPYLSTPSKFQNFSKK